MCTPAFLTLSFVNEGIKTDGWCDNCVVGLRVSDLMELKLFDKHCWNHIIALIEAEISL